MPREIAMKKNGRLTPGAVMAWLPSLPSQKASTTP
jgi:hypothetical protein